MQDAAPSQPPGPPQPEPLYEKAPARTFKEAILVSLQDYHQVLMRSFSGRASRSEYWFFMLFTLIAGVLGAILELLVFGYVRGIIGLILVVPAMAVGFRRLHDTGRPGWWVGGLYVLAFLVEILFARTEQCNARYFTTSYDRSDLSQVADALARQTSAMADCYPIIMVSGLLLLVFFVYLIVLLVFLCKKGDPGPNQFG
jgi:uncharacterized membrane protein YhaH (DUF805 family)